MLLFLGCFMDQVSMMLLTLPFFMPLANALQMIRPLWLGVILLISLQIGLLDAALRPAAVRHEGRGAAAHHDAAGLGRGDALHADRVRRSLVIVFAPSLATWLPRSM